MQLYSSPLSPFARKVRILILEKGLSDQVEILAANPYEASDDLLKANPLSKVPALIIDEGQSLYDSAVICEYLDSLSEPRLIPGEQQRIAGLKHLALSDGLLQATFSIAAETFRRPENERSPTWIARWVASIERGLDELERVVPAYGTELSLPHIGAVCALDYIAFRAGDKVNWQTRNPTLLPWYEQFGQSPSMVSTRPQD